MNQEALDRIEAALLEFEEELLERLNNRDSGDREFEKSIMQLSHNVLLVHKGIAELKDRL